MQKEMFTFEGYEGVQLPAVLWLPEGEVKAVMQVTHGMTEHMGRYETLAAYLTEQGIAVAGFDLRGHGQNAGHSTIASFGENGWKAVVEDMHLFLEGLKTRFGEMPIYMYGFSLGSFLVRDYLCSHKEGLAGAILVGTGSQPMPILLLMKAIVKGEMKKVGPDETTSKVRKLLIETYNKRFKPNRTPSDWLCSDEAEVDAYRADPMRREDISASLFWQMLDAMERTGDLETLLKSNRDLPILMLAGREDPVGNKGKGVWAVRKKLNQAAVWNVKVHLLSGARHDLFHEEASGAAENARGLLSRWILRQK